MPLYEYRCEDCRRRFTLLVGMVARPQEAVCPKCGSPRLAKLVSRFRTLRSEDDLLDSVADPSRMGDPDDPKAMADWMRRVSREMGEDMDEDFEELVEEAVREEKDGAADEGDGTAVADEGL